MDEKTRYIVEGCEDPVLRSYELSACYQHSILRIDRYCVAGHWLYSGGHTVSCPIVGRMVAGLLVLPKV